MRKNEEDNAVDEDKKSLKRAARIIFELSSRIIFSYFYLSGLKLNQAPFYSHGKCSPEIKVVPFVRAYSYSDL